MYGSFFFRNIFNRFPIPKPCRRTSLVAALSLAAAALLASTDHASAQFVTRDATRYTENPNLAPYGFKNLVVAYKGSLWPSGTSSSQPYPDYIARYYIPKIRSLNPDVVVLDLEFWTFPAGMTSSQITAQIAKYKKVIDVFRRELPKTKIGVYMVLPERNWLAPCGDPGKKASRTSAWHSRNLKLQPLANLVDIVFPSLYTFYGDSASIACWPTYAKANIAEAKIYGKPVWAFLWMKYKSNFAWIPSSFWRKQLDTVHGLANGVVIWSMAGTDKWSWTAPWWLQTKDFANDRNLY